MNWLDILITLPPSIWVIALIGTLMLSGLLFILRRKFEISEISVNPPNLKLKPKALTETIKDSQSRATACHPKAKREYYSAIWLIGNSPEEVEGPLCKVHLLKMVSPPTTYDRYDRGFSRPTHTVCEICGANTEDVPFAQNEWEIKVRVYERFLAEQRTIHAQT